MQLINIIPRRLLSLINYSIPSYISSLLSIIFFPVIALKLGVINLGRYELYLTFIAALTFIFHIGWSSSYTRFLGEKNQLKITSTLFISRIFIYLVSVFLFFLFKNLITNLFEFNVYEHISLLVFFIFITTDLGQFFKIYCRVNSYSNKYASLEIIELISLYITFGIFIISNEVNSQNLLIAKSISCFITLLYGNLLFPELLNFKCFDWKIFKECLKFGSPLIFAGIGLFAIEYTDKLMLRSLIGSSSLALASIGYYAFSERIASIFNILSSAFRITWMPFVLNTFKKKESIKFYKNILNSYIFGFTSVSIFISLTCFYLIPILFTDYLLSLKLIPIIASTLMIYYIGDYFPIGIDINKKTKYRAFAALIAILSNLILNYFFIKQFGVIGAGIASYISVFIFSYIQLFYSNHLMKVPYDFHFLIFCSLIGPLQAIMFNILNIDFLLIIDIIIFISLFYYVKKDLSALYSFFIKTNEIN